MENILPEIMKLKNNIMLLSNNLLCKFDVNQEISIINEFKKVIENLSSLLNTKKNNPSLCQNPLNNMNFAFPPLPMMTPIFNNNYNNNQFDNNFFQKEMEKINQCMQYYAKEMNNLITVYIKKDKFSHIIQGYTNEKIENLIERYRMQTLDMDKTEKFIFNSKPLLPELTVAQAGLTNGSAIYIEENKG